jgi:DNA-binding CsgD family transcriptional regulator
MTLKGMTNKDLAAKLQISPVTLYRKIERDGDFTRKEILQLIEILDISDPVEVFFTS